MIDDLLLQRKYTEGKESYKLEEKPVYLTVHGKYHSPLLLKEEPINKKDISESIDDIIQPSEKQLLNRQLLIEDHPHYLENKSILKDYPDLTKKSFNMYELKITREKNKDYQIQTLSNPKAVYDTFKKRAEQQDREELLVIFANSQNQLIGYHQVAVGTLTYVVTSPREIIKSALLANAHSMILVHNHPSGNPTPSQNDLELTDNIKKACEIMEVPLLDHIIIGENGKYTSLKQQGKI